jgi:crotonobetainyl-CoA:carnitine CoA-transferase CaiB-like acyl-CoA transferase
MNDTKTDTGTKTAPTAGPGPLSGYRVVELGVWVAGPSAAGLMADWGADVVKVEPPTGDPQRNVFGAVGVTDQHAVPPFEIDNRGKRSVVLDLQQDDARAQMEQLLETADVFVTNVRPGALERLSLDHESVLGRHPRVVYASLTGYGLNGAERDRAGYDIGAYWARSGIAHTLVPEGELPPPVRSGMGDHVTGISLAAGVLAKLIERERTGTGGLVATSLLRAGLYSLGWDIGIVLRFGRRQSTRPRARHTAPLVNCYRAGDGRSFWLLCLEAARHWPKLVAAVGLDDLAADPRFATPVLQAKNSEDFVAALDAAFAEHSFDELTRRFDEHDVWWAPINSIADVLEDPQAHASGGFVEMTPRDGEAPYRAVNGPVDFGGYDFRPGPVPTLGEHTSEILRELDARS